MNQPGVKGSPEWWQRVLLLLGGSIPEPDSVEDLTALEARIARPVCASYRALLLTSNGFPVFGEHVGRLLPATEVDWYAKRNPVAAQEISDFLKQGNPSKPEGFEDPKWRSDIPLHSLEITEPRDGVSLLLHPKRGRGGGEWEVWLLRGAMPKRFPTLPDFAEYEVRKLGKRTPSGVPAE